MRWLFFPSSGGGVSTQANSLTNSKWIGGSIPPTSWSLGGSLTGTGTLITDGDHRRIRFAGTTKRYWIVQDVAVVSGEQWCLSLQCDAIASPGDANAIVDFTGMTHTIDQEMRGNSLVVGERAVHVVSFTQTGTAALRIGLGVDHTASGDFTLSRPKLEPGAFDTGYLAT